MPPSIQEQIKAIFYAVCLETFIKTFPSSVGVANLLPANFPGHPVSIGVTVPSVFSPFSLCERALPLLQRGGG